MIDKSKEEREEREWFEKDGQRERYKFMIIPGLTLAPSENNCVCVFGRC